MKRAKDKAVVAAFEKVLLMILGKYFQHPMCPTIIQYIAICDNIYFWSLLSHRKWESSNWDQVWSRWDPSRRELRRSHKSKCSFEIFEHSGQWCIEFIPFTEKYYFYWNQLIRLFSRASNIIIHCYEELASHFQLLSGQWFSNSQSKGCLISHFFMWQVNDISWNEFEDADSNTEEDFPWDLTVDLPHWHPLNFLNPHSCQCFPDKWTLKMI